jgi:hypothetical protein
MPQTIADRIQKAAKLRGHTSGRSESGVDVRKMSEGIEASYEMARRYAEGAAVPPPDVARAIATWLKVSVTWLLYGDGTMDSSASDIDVPVLKKCIEVALEAQRIAGIALPSSRLASLVVGLYKQATKGPAPSAQTVAATLGALAT